MKIEARRVEAFLADLGRVRVVLFHGEDEGQIRILAGSLVRRVAGSLDDPFRVSDVGRDGWSRLGEEVAALSLIGGRRVVRVRDAGDGLAAAVQAILDKPASELLVLEGHGLGSKSKLRALVERSADGATIACYPLEGRAVLEQARSTLQGLGVTADGEALDWLAGHLGADQAVMRAELEKLALYAGEGGRVDLDAARQCVGDLSGLSLEDALYAAVEGDAPGADRALEIAMSEGAAPVAVVRAGLMHMQKLATVVSAVAAGGAAEDVIRGLRPPVFYKRVPAMQRAARIWTPAAVEQALGRLWAGERLCKRTGIPADIVCRNAIMGVASRAAALRRR